MSRIHAAAPQLFWLVGVVAAAAIAAPEDGTALVSQYVAMAQKSSDALRGASMSVVMHGSIPRLNREGTVKATRTISPTGEISYSNMTSQGDDSIKRDVVARYLTEEVEVSKQPSLGITPANYKFKYKGRYGSGDWQLELFQLTPRHKAQGLFEGWLWIEAKTGLPVREQGTFVKNPSVFLKKMSFIRDYDISSGMARPTHMEGTILTRVVSGEVKLAIEYSDYSGGPAPPPESKVAAVQ